MARRATRQTFKVVKLSKANGNKWYKVERYFNGKRERFYFVSKKEADADCRDRNNQIVANGTQNVLNDSQRVEAAEAYRTLSLYGKSIRDAVAFYKDHLDRLGSSIPLSELIEKVRDYEHSRRISGEITIEWYRTIIDRTREFRERFGDIPSKLLDGEDVKRWLATLNNSRTGNPITVRSRNGILSTLRTVFKDAVSLKLLPTNPLDGIEPFHDKTRKSRKIVILSPEDTEKFLDVVELDWEPYFAICAFTGLRPAEVKRLDWSEIKLGQISEQFPLGLIDLPKEKSKNHNRKMIEVTANLKAWLEPRVEQSGSIMPKGKKLQHAQESAEEAAGITWKQNCLRHSFCSYGTAERGATWASEQADHDIRIHKRDYLEVVTKEEAKKYFAIYPKAIVPKEAEGFPEDRLLTDEELETLQRCNLSEYIQRKLAQSLGWTLAQFRAERLALASA